MINQREWLQTRKKLLEQVKSQVQIRIGPLPDSLRHYAKNQNKDFRGKWVPGTMRDLNQALAKAKVALSGDFHAYAQSQRAHVRLLRDHVSRPIILALECLLPRHQEVAESYLHGRISEKQFLDSVEWSKNWGFPWENYRPLFELARDRGCKIVALGGSGGVSLPKHDIWMTKQILRAHRTDPEALVFVVVGEWHVASAHLPRLLKSKLPGVSDVAVFHQDIEQLYFKLAVTNQESAIELLKGGKARFCLMVSPPWMKWQSYLMFLEQAYDRDLQEDLAIDYSDHVVSLIELLEADLKVSLKKTLVQVYCSNSKTSLSRLRLSFPVKQEKCLVYHLEHGLSFLIPQKGWMYLSRPTINHASALAGQFVHAALSQREQMPWNLPHDFLPLIWLEAVGFFFSKSINPKRKAETLANVRLQLAARHPGDNGRKALLLALDHRLSEVLWVQTGRLRRAQFKPRDMSAYLDAARIVGSMLGERLFQKVRSRTISLAKLMSYLKVNVEGQDFSKFYWKLIGETEHDQVL